MPSKIKSEALEPKAHRTVAYLFMNCPYCSKENKLYLGNMDDQTAPDVEACQCWSCNKKFWTPEQKEFSELDACMDLDDGPTPEELGLQPDDDLIESVYCEKGEKP